MINPLGLFFILLGLTNDETLGEGSKWSRRTARKRDRVGHLLDSIPPPSYAFDGIQLGTSPLTRISTLEIETLTAAPVIDWSLYPILDPQGGGLLKPDSPRATRKRRQIEAFVHLIRTTLNRNMSRSNVKPLLIDAGSGAGNLAIPLAHLLNCKVLAIDVNNGALARLNARDTSVATLCADLASPDIVFPPEASMVCSLHACGAATDLAIRLATSHGLPFCVSPCCTAKSLTTREQSARYGPSTSFQRSGSPSDLTYPRSNWLRSSLSSPAEEYSLIAKVADVGLGPQTPTSQREHQRLAKLIVELDRLSGAVERHNYSVSIFRIQDHEEHGKAEILLGLPSHSS
jgi:Methyltransferase domain